MFFSLILWALLLSVEATKRVRKGETNSSNKRQNCSKQSIIDLLETPEFSQVKFFISFATGQSMTDEAKFKGTFFKHLPLPCLFPNATKSAWKRSKQSRIQAKKPILVLRIKSNV